MAASNTSKLKTALNCIRSPQASVNSIFNEYVPLLVVVKFSNSKLIVVAIISEVIPSLKLHSKIGLKPAVIIPVSVNVKVTSFPLQYFKSLLLIVVPESSEISIGESKEAIKGGNP